jgi:group I intron endonuclease
MDSGVYMLKNLNNGKVYIGSSRSLPERKYRHFYRLKNNTHHNPYLQNAFNKEQGIVFGVIKIL